MAKRPGGELATRPLHFIWLADCSGSMSIDGKIQALNNAIREALPRIRTVPTKIPTPKCWCGHSSFLAAHNGMYLSQRQLLILNGPICKLMA